MYAGVCLPLEMSQRIAATTSTARMTSQKSRPRKNSGRRNHIACPNPQNMGILSFSQFTFIFANATLRYTAFAMWNNATYRYILIYDMSRRQLQKLAHHFFIHPVSQGCCKVPVYRLRRRGDRRERGHLALHQEAAAPWTPAFQTCNNPDSLALDACVCELQVL